MERSQDTYYIDRVLKGDINAFSFLVNKYKDVSFNLAYRIIKNIEDTEEIIQDAFLKAYRSLHTFEKEASFSTWLYRIVYNSAISKTRSNKHKMVEIDFDTADIHIVNQAEKVLDKLKEEDQKKYILAALDKLEDDESAIISLYYLEELSVEEISQITGLTKSNIKIKLYRARKKLLKYLEIVLKDEVRSLL